MLLFGTLNPIPEPADASSMVAVKEMAIILTVENNVALPA